MIKETALQRQILDWLLYNGFYAWRANNIAAPNRKFKGLYGVPDIIVILPGGLFWGIEVKSARGKQSFYQKSFQENCECLGGYYTLARKLDDVIIYLNENFSEIKSQVIKAKKSKKCQFRYN